MTTRLYLGGLSLELPEEELTQQLSNFATVKKLEIKEKKDLVTGEVLKRFAFATLEAPQSRIEQCIHSLQGKSLHGSELTLERAQESFIDRLNREREARAQGKTIDKTNHNNNSYQQNKQFDESYQFNFASHDESNTRNNHYEEDYSRQQPPPQGGYEDTSRYGGQKRGRGWGDDEDEEKEKHKVPEELFPSSVYRNDEDQHYQGGDVDSRHRAASPPQKFAKMAPRYDPKKKSATASRAAATDTKQSEQSAEQTLKPAPTTVSADLAFTGASQGFSLLSMLEEAEPITIVAKDALEETDATEPPRDEVSEKPSQQQTDVKPTVETQVPVTEKKQKTEVKTYVKRFKFFVDADDPEVEENLRWVYQEIPKSQLSKFTDDRPEIVKLYTEWHRKAQSEKRKDGTTYNTFGHKLSRDTSTVFENDGEAAVMAAAYDECINSEPVTLTTDSLVGTVQTIGPAEEVPEKREGGGKYKRMRGSKGKGRKPLGGGRGGKKTHGEGQRKEARGKCPR